MLNLFLAAFSLFALTRAEIVARMKAPVITQADGLIKVFADCPEDMRREYQMPIASFAADTVKMLYAGSRRNPLRFKRPSIIIHVGDVRTNLTTVVANVETNDDRRILTRIYLKAPGFADLGRFRLEVVKGFVRAVDSKDISDSEAIVLYRAADPVLRLADKREGLERWLKRGEGADYDEGLKLMRNVMEPGRASERDVLIFASRLFFYPPQYDLKFQGKYDKLSFREALAVRVREPGVRLLAAKKLGEMPIFGGGRGESMTQAYLAYMKFLRELAEDKVETVELEKSLDEADEKLRLALEESRRKW